MMGLHCHDPITPGQMDLDLSLDEIVERRKLFRSLYIRERCYATARGTLRRLPRYITDTKSEVSSRAMSQDASSATLTAAHCEAPLVSVPYSETNEPLFTMAMIQDDLHAAMFPNNPSETRMMEQKMALSSIRQSLVDFARTHRLPYLKRPQTFQDLSIHLAYLGTRIRAYELDLAEHNVLDDARLSCLLVMSACSDEKGLDTGSADKLDRLLRRMAHRNWCQDNTAVLPQSPGGSRKASAALPTQEEQLNSPRAASKRFWPFGSDSLASPNIHLLRKQRVLELMPTSAIFILARSILGIKRNAVSAHQPAPSGSVSTDKEPEDELFGSVFGDFAVLCELARILESSLDLSSETQNSYSSKLLRVVQTLVSFLREAVKLPGQQSLSSSDMRHDMLECSLHTDTSPEDILDLSTNSGAADASFMNLGTTWESPQGAASLSFPFSPSFDLSSMNISSVPDSLFDFDFSQHFENVGGLMSPAEHLPDTDSLRSATEQEKRRKRLRLDCSQDLDGPADIMLSTWPPRNRTTMARGSV